jgi:sugar lactone lactonase YvrE
MCPGILTLTPSSIRAGFGISTFATDFTSQSGAGVVSILFRDQGGELVTDMNGDVRLFPTDSDGQSTVYVPPTQSYALADALALAKVGANIYMTQENSGKVVQVNDTGNFVGDIVSNLLGASGIVANPKNGHLFVDNGVDTIYDVDPKARTSKQFVQSGYDYGLAITPDGGTLYAADFVGNHVMGFDTATGKSVFDSGNIAGSPSGLALGTGRLAGHLYVSTLDGSLLDIDVASRSQTMIATGGQRGDLLTIDPSDGSLLVTQTDRIVRVRFPSGPVTSFRIDAAASVLPGQPFVATVTAVDVDGRVATGYTGTVKFTSSDPYPGLVPPSYTFTPGDNSTHNLAAAFFTAGTQMLTAQDTANSSLSGNATVTVHAAPATHLKITAPPATVAGSSFDVTVAALDSYGNADPSYTGTVSFTSTDSASGTVLPADYTFTAADKGTHTFTGGATLLSAGARTLTATDKANGNFTVSASLLVMPAPATHLLLAAPVAAVAGVPFNVTVTALDPYGNVDSNYNGTLSFHSTDTHPGVLPSDYTFSSTDKGAHTFAGVTLFTAMENMVTAQDAANASLTASAPVTVTAGPVFRFAIAAPASAGAGKPISITVTAFDAYGNLETSYTGTITFTSSDPHPALLPPDYTYTPSDNGTANFGMAFYTPGQQTLIVTDTFSGVASTVTVMVG